MYLPLWKSRDPIPTYIFSEWYKNMFVEAQLSENEAVTGLIAIPLAFTS